MLIILTFEIISNVTNHVRCDTNDDVPLDRSCTDAEHQAMLVGDEATNGGSKPHIPIKDTGFYGSR